MELKPEKLRAMSIAELDKEERDLREEIWKLRLQQTTGQLQDPRKVRGKILTTPPRAPEP